MSLRSWFRNGRRVGVGVAPRGLICTGNDHTRTTPIEFEHNFVLGIGSQDEFRIQRHQ